MRPFLPSGLLLTFCAFLLFGCGHSVTTPAVNNSICNPDLVDLLVQQKILVPEGLSEDDKPIGYKFGCADLNGDGRQEVFVLMQHLWFCGTGGCSAFIFDSQGNEISQMSVTDEPILLSDQRHHGWRDFYVWSNGAMRLMPFNGDKYPGNPSMQPVYNNKAEVKAAYDKVMATELYQQDGHQLKLLADVPIFQPEWLYSFSFLHYGDPTTEYLMKVNMKTGQMELATRPLSK